MDNSRYKRQTILDRIGKDGQQQLLDSSVAIVGCGGLGSIAAPYLAGAGVGHLILIDGDVPHISNLHRQVFFSEEETEETKSQVLSNHIRRLNSDVTITTYDKMINKSNISTVLDGVDLVMECTDNIMAKYLVNDYCHKMRIPVSYGAIYKYDGYVSFFENKDNSSIHLRDIFPVPNQEIPSCSDVGVLGTLAGLIGILQANEVIKHFTNAGDTLVGKLLSYDILTNNQMKLKLKKTWMDNINATYDSLDYPMQSVCTAPEITLEEILKNREKYELISILEDGEHKSIDNQVIWIPVGEFDIRTWTPVAQKHHVFYCISGKRSGQLVTKLQSKHKNVFSLAGGLEGASPVSI